MKDKTSRTKLCLGLCVASIFSFGGLVFPSHLPQPKLNQPVNSLPTTSRTGVATNAPRLRAEQAAPDLASPQIEALAPLSRDGQAALDNQSGDQASEAAEFYRLKRAPEGDTAVPVGRYLTAREQMRAMRRYSTAQENFLSPHHASPHQTQAAGATALGAWTHLGPGNIGGRTRALLIHPTNSNVMYAAGGAGGVWKTTNGGASWLPLTDLIANIAVNALAMDPTNPNVLYAGTGEGYFNNDAVRGLGIFKTTDGGNNWTHLTNTANSDFHYVNDLVISPTSSQRIYAATRTGIWRSLDGGASWARVLDPAINGGCLDLAIRTDQATDYLFAACGTLTSTSAVIYRNTDAGGAGAWAPVHTEVGMGRTSLAIAPSDQNVIYAASASVVNGTYLHGLHAVFRSTSSGDPGTWTARVRNSDAVKLNTLLFSNAFAASRTDCGLGTNVFFSQGWFDNVIAVDPGDAHRVWVGGIDLFRSDDGGVNWGQALYGSADKTAPQYAPADQHAITFHPQYNGSTNQTMFIGNDGGIFRTDNARAAVATGPTGPCNPSNSAVTWTTLNHDYSTTLFYHGLPFPDGESYVGGTQSTGTILGTNAAGINGWRELLGGNTGYVAIDPTNINTLYTANTGLSITKSSDGGATFTSANLGLGGASLFIVPTVMDPSEPQRLWTGGVSLFRTTDGAARWTRVIASVAGGGVSAIAIAPTDANYMLIGTSSGFIQRTDSGLTAAENTPWPSARPRSGFLSWLAFDPTNRNIAYATYSTFGDAHVWRSTDAGASWTPIDGFGGTGLPDIPVHCLVVDPNNTARLYVGTDLGVFVSLDGGATWAVENTGFANVATESLALNTVGGVTSLYAFTHGRGAWRVTVGTSGCHYALSPTGQVFEASGGTGMVSVTASPNGCAWTASSNVSWITITSSGSGSGNGTVNYSVEPYTGVSPRVGTLNIAGRSFTVTQSNHTSAPLTVKITSPASSGIFKTEESFINLTGTMTNGVGYVQMSWENDRGYSLHSPSNGTSPWSFTSMPLFPGMNRITVRAIDSLGRTSSATLAVLYTSSSVIYTMAGNGETNFNGDHKPALSTALDGTAGLVFDAAGNLYFADSFHNRVRKLDVSTGIITTIAGNGLESFGGDGGPAATAQLNWPSGLARDLAGNLYVADSGNNRIRKIAPNGTISTVAGNGTFNSGGDGGPATAAQLKGPIGVVVDSAGHLYITDYYGGRVRKVDAQTGIITTIAGGGTNEPGVDGPATAAHLGGPIGLLLDGAGNLLIADKGSHSIRKVSLTTGLMTRIAGSSTSNSGFAGDGGPASAAMLSMPSHLAFDRAGHLYIADSGNRRVRKVSATTGIISTVAAGVQHAQGEGLPANGSDIVAGWLAFDGAGNLIIGGGTKIWKLLPFPSRDTTPPTIKLTTPTTESTYTTTQPNIDLAGTLSDNLYVSNITYRNDRGGTGFAGISCCPSTNWGVRVYLQVGINHLTVTAWDASGNSSSLTLTVNYTEPVTVRTLAGKLDQGFSGDGGAGLGAQFSRPEEIALDAAGNLYVADTNNHRIRKIARDGTITTFAGSGLLTASGDGGPATAASLNVPRGVAVDGQGNVYISDTHNHRVRQVNPAGIISTIAGTGVWGYSGDGGAATEAQLNSPMGLAVDPAGNLYIADYLNSRIRKVNLSTGLITTVAGTGAGYSGDGGPATQAKLFAPTRLVADSAGNLYISDAGNNCVRKVTAAGIISTIVGTGQFGSVINGVLGTMSPLISPNGLALDRAGNLYIAATSNLQILKMTTDGIIHVIAGTYSSLPTPNLDGEAPFHASFNYPIGIAVDRAGNVYVSDTQNHRIRVISNYHANTTTSAASYDGTAVAAGGIASAFGLNLATSIQGVDALPLPTVLAGTSVQVRDSANVERPAQLFFVSPGQVNYLIPPGTAEGVATIFIASGDGHITTGTVRIDASAPGLFSANADGEGAPAAVALRVKPGGEQIYEEVAQLDSARQRYVPRPLDLSDPNDQMFLLLFGTGIATNSGPSPATAKLDGEEVEVLYAGPQGGFVGLDQVNLRIPRNLMGRGEVNLELTVNGQAANPMKLSFSGSPCQNTIAPAGQNFPTAGGTGTVNVTATGNCYWAAASQADWITIHGGSNGSGPGAVSYSVATNTSLDARIGTLRIAGQTYTVTQAGAVDPAAPIITINSPTTTGSFTTSALATSLHGTASAASGAASGIALVTWSNDRGGGGVASGTTAWIIDQLQLQVGVNHLTVTAYDQTGRTSSAKLAVTVRSELTITTVAGGNDPNGATFALRAELDPFGLALDPHGNLYLAERAVIRKITPSGEISLVAGTGTPGYNGDDRLATTAQIDIALGLTFDSAGNLYFVDYNNGYGLIRKVDAVTGLITSVVGKGGNWINAGDGGPALEARLEYPSDVIFDVAGNLYISESWRIRKVDATTKIITTIAGGGTDEFGDGGPAKAAKLHVTGRMTFDPQGNLLIANANRVRQVNLTTGIITTIAGSPYSQTGTGDGGPAVGANIGSTALAFDRAGNLLISEYGRIRKVSAETGIITTIVGTGTLGFSGDGGPAIMAEVNEVRDLVVDQTGNIYLVDRGNFRVRKLMANGQ